MSLYPWEDESDQNQEEDDYPPDVTTNKLLIGLTMILLPIASAVAITLVIPVVVCKDTYHRVVKWWNK
jgi:hypothetical protein